MEYAYRYVKTKFSSVQSLSRVRLFATPWIAARQASLSITSSRSSLRLTSIESVMPSSHLILCHPLLLLPPVPPSIRVFSNESALCIRWPKYWSFSFSISPSSKYSGLISFSFSSVQFSRSVLSDSLRPHESQHARAPCPSTNSQNSLRLTSIESVMPSSHLILSHPLFLLLPIPPSIRVFSNESTLHMRWPKYWSFSFSIIPSKENPRADFLQNGLVGSPCSPRDSQESSPTPQFKSINSSGLSFLHSPTLTSIHDHWKDHSLD